MPELHVSRELAWALAWLAGAVATDMVAIPALVMSHGFRRLGWAALSIAAIFGSFFCMRRVVTVIPLGVAYAIWSGVGTAGVCLLSFLLFQEAMPLVKVAGIAFVIAGMLAINLDKPKPAPQDRN